MACGTAREVFDLLAARDAEDHDVGVLMLAHRREEAPLPGGPREPVMLLFVPERAGHAAAVGIRELHLVAGQPEDLRLVPGSANAFWWQWAWKSTGRRSAASWANWSSSSLACSA